MDTMDNRTKKPDRVALCTPTYKSTVLAARPFLAGRAPPSGVSHPTARIILTQRYKKHQFAENDEMTIVDVKIALWTNGESCTLT